MTQVLLIILFLQICFKFVATSPITDESRIPTTLESCLHRSGLGAILKRQGAQNFDSINYQWNTRLADIVPLAILVPDTVSDISNAIGCARRLKLKVVPKSGGNSYEKYSFGDNGTLVIDLRNFDTIQVDSANRTVTVGAGTILAHLYWKLWTSGKFGLPAGTCVTLGAGLTLGGGYGYTSKLWGMTLDNVLEMEVVDPSGDLQVVSAEMNEDLFWALRGAGGGNFAIVTKFKYRVYDVSTTNFTHIRFTFNISKLETVFGVWQTWVAKTQNGSTYGSLVVGPTTIGVTIVGDDLSDQEVNFIKEFFKPEAKNGTVSIKSQNFIQMVAGSSTPAVPNPESLNTVTREHVGKNPYAAKSYYSSRRINDTEIEMLSNVLTETPSNVFLLFSAYGGAINRIPVDATAFVHRNSLYMIQVGVSEFNNVRIEEWLEKLNALIIQTLDNGESYQNYVDGTLSTGTRSYLNRYYGSNLEKLMKIKKKFDPNNIFRFPQSIPAAL